MVIHALGTSSKGNCYLVETSTGILVIDPGIRYEKIIEAIDYELELIEGVLVSHAHGDHSFAADKLSKVGLEVWTPEKRETRYIGSWTVTSAPVVHDVDTFAFLASHREGSFLYVTDTCEIPFKASADVLMIEANFCEEILANRVLNGRIEPFVRDRIRKTHMSIDNVLDWLRKNDLSRVQKIILLHLSDGNSNAREFKDRVESLTGIPTYIAENGESY